MAQVMAKIHGFISTFRFLIEIPRASCPSATFFSLNVDAGLHLCGIKRISMLPPRVSGSGGPGLAAVENRYARLEIGPAKRLLWLLTLAVGASCLRFALDRRSPENRARTQVLHKLRNWWASRRPRAVSELLTIQCDDDGARIRVLGRFALTWNQEFLWKDVTRVCFKDGGDFSSDMMFVETGGRKKPVAVLMEARGATQFFGQLVQRGLFPREIALEAINCSDGGFHCWPPAKSEGG
jgi:hypothetical protein